MTDALLQKLPISSQECVHSMNATNMAGDLVQTLWGLLADFHTENPLLLENLQICREANNDITLTFSHGLRLRLYYELACASETTATV